MPNPHANHHAHENAAKREERKKLKAIRKKVVVDLVEVAPQVQVDHAELLGYVEGLKFATEDKPMPIYNAEIERQLVGEGLAKTVLAMNEKGETVTHLICIDEEQRAFFEGEVRGLNFDL